MEQKAWQSPQSEKPSPKVRTTAVDANGKAIATPTAKKSGKRKVGAEPFEPRANILPFEAPDVSDNKLLDGQIAEKAISEMK